MAMALLACTLPAFAQTRAWLDRDQVTYGETVTLNIETDTSVQQIDYAPLTAQFDIAGQTVRRSFQLVNGRSSTRSLFAVGIRPRGPGVLTVPALRVGNSNTEPLRMTVTPPTVQPANSNADAFVETEVDAQKPYVQQAVGMVVRLFVGVNLLSGQLDQDSPPDSTLQQVGEDIRYQRQIDGRRFNVIERRYLLIPERSGTLAIPGARFNGQSVSGFFDGAFGDGRTPLSAAAPTKYLQVQPIPANAPQPWLPLRDLQLRYLQAPQQARAGEATTLELEMVADGASATQLPTLAFPLSNDMQVFADPPQSDMQLVDGRPRTTLRQRISVVPLHAGTLNLAGPSIDWWDATQGIARTATLPPLQLQVAPGAVVAPRDDAPAIVPAPADGTVAPASIDRWQQLAPWLLLVIALAASFAWWRLRRQPVREDVASTLHASTMAPSSMPSSPSLAQALKQGDLAVIAHALCLESGLNGDDLDAVRARLDDAAQVAAVEQLQAARWGSDEAGRALAALRRAFATGMRWRKPEARAGDSLLPPLYPE